MNVGASVADADLPRLEGRSRPVGGGADERAPGPGRATGTFLSLFAGIGGLDLALEYLGWECVGQVEWDGWCSEQLARHWPTVPRWGDVREIAAASYADRRSAGGDGRAASRPQGADAGRGEPDERRRPSDAARVDLICGGFPCQPVSHAGRRKAQEDDRWLWPEFARVVRELGPRWVVVENVPGLLSAGDPHGSALGEVLRDLAEMGFDARWGSVRASDIGAPHRRERFFLVAERADSDGETRGSARSAGQAVLRPGPVERPGRLRDDAPDSDLQRREERGLPAGERWVGQEVPDTAGSGRLGTDTASPNGSRDADQGAAEESGADGERVGSGDHTAWGPYRPAIERWERVVGPAPAPLTDGRLSADFVEWMMGLPAGWTEGKRNARLKALGNAVVRQQAVLALSLLGIPSPTAVRGSE